MLPSDNLSQLYHSKKVICFFFSFFNFFVLILISSKNATPGESSSIQLEKVNSMVLAHGAPWVHLVLSFHAGSSGWCVCVCVSLWEDWLFTKLFSNQQKAVESWRFLKNPNRWHKYFIIDYLQLALKKTTL